MKCLFLLFGCWLAAGLTCAQAQEPRQLQALRISGSIKTDGQLDEPEWQQAAIAASFTQSDPVNGAPSRFRTEVRVLYDAEALYVGAQLFDPAPDSILTQLGRRDANDLNADFFGVYFDPYLDRQNGYGFEVSAAGVQTDMRLFNATSDLAWDAVWASAVKRTPEGWAVEMKIPYSALRFSKAPVQTWGLNFMRLVRRSREKSYWQFVNASVQGFVNQFGQLRGLEALKAPLRLSLTPYVAAGLQQHTASAETPRTKTNSVSGGMDLKYGLNESFTLDMTLVPDFRQVQSDAVVLNLTPFEVRFNENRPFFTEGVELFNKGGLFYSRRIGGQPLRYHQAGQQLRPGERLLENPHTARLVNATKLTGRTTQGTGIGIFNAVTRNAFALTEDSAGNKRSLLTDPAANFNVLVIDQSLRNNSYLTFTNTNVSRSQGFYDANVSGLQLRLADRTNTYALRSGGNFSYLRHHGQPDVKGHQYTLQLAKVSGPWQYSLAHGAESDRYNINDLGYLPSNNTFSFSGNLRFSRFQPVWRLLNASASLYASYEMVYFPRTFTTSQLSFNGYARFRNFLSAGLTVSGSPVSSFDYFEPRTPGRYWRNPAHGTLNAWISTDYRKRLALDVTAEASANPGLAQTGRMLRVSPRVRLSDKVLLISGCRYTVVQHDVGYAGKANGEVYFGARERKTLESNISAAYIFSARSALTLNLRHYWSGAHYRQFYALLADGTLQPDLAFSRADINFNAFTVDMVYTWRFAPGSELNLVWKNAIYSEGKELQPAYFRNVSQTLAAPQTNSLSVKVLYYLDYRLLQKAWRG